MLARHTAHGPWAAAGLALATLLLSGCGPTADTAGDAESSPAPDAGSETAEASTEATDISPDPSLGTGDSPSSGTQREVTLPVYWVTATEQAGPRLIREFTRERTDDPLLTAANLVVSGTPADDGYRTLWPAGEIAAVSATGDRITVELADDSWSTRPANMTPRAARQALQQMVYTVQGVAQGRPPVFFTVDGAPATVFGIDTARGIRAATPLGTLNLVSITAPESGATISGDRLEITGVANSFEANVVCQVVQDQQIRASAPFTADGWMGEKLFPFRGELSLADAQPGPALVRCSTDDPTGGTEGVGIFSDDKSVTLR